MPTCGPFEARDTVRSSNSRSLSLTARTGMRMSKDEIKVWRRRGKVKGCRIGDENDVTLEENELGG
jgi:hypothetical protein